MGCRRVSCSGVLSPAPVPRPLLRDFLLGCGNRRNFVSVPASGHTKVRATTWVTNFSFSFRKLQRLRDSRAEERIPPGIRIVERAAGVGFAVPSSLGRFGPVLLFCRWRQGGTGGQRA